MINIEEAENLLSKFCEGLTQKELNKISLYKSDKLIKRFLKKYNQKNSWKYEAVTDRWGKDNFEPKTGEELFGLFLIDINN